ncbi:hypothetical protein [Streptomyces poriferorum]|uniref:hypothetical protein n=1 Tax=Streptomyces poriferorum TaxID=2798799 RepID=UPI001C5D512B|nr:hypothetical protein [Streptomyces poriferorum]MBW5255356.1 hypothetical protein [Streptomyces poriferorum]
MPAPSVPRGGRAFVLAAALAFSLTGPVPSATAGALRPVAVTTQTGEPAAASATVTLVTGDTVTVTTAPDGRTSFAAEPAPGTEASFHTESTPSGDTYVIPDSAGEGLAEGRLDRELFNVTRLVADGRDDAGGDTLPLIVDYAGSAVARSTLTARAAAAPGVERHSVLPSLGATAVAVDKGELSDFYRDVLDGPKAVIHPDRKYGDSDPGHYGTGVSSTTYTYRRDGQELPAAQLFAPQEAEYRIDQTVRRRTTALETLGTRTDTSYTFRSKAPGAGDTATGCTEVFGAGHPCAVLPVIFIDYDLALDGANSAPAGRVLPVRIGTHRTDGYRGAAVTGVRVEASYDDGITWSTATEPHVRRDGTATTVLHRAPADAKAVTLRVTAWDRAGNRTRQTIVRAFALRG